jgi:thymidylate synthase
MYNVRAYCIGKAHEEVIKTIIKHGKFLITEDGEKTLELPEPLSIHIKDPFTAYMISPYNMFGKNAMQQYVTDLIKGTASEFVYTYHNRLFDYPHTESDTEQGIFAKGDGDNEGTNQIDYIIKKLQQEPNSRRAMGITWFPFKDMNSDNPPCLQRIQCFVRGNRLNMHVEFRSNDMLSALGANMYALVHLQKHIADSLNADCGWYSHTSVSAHMYYDRDFEELMRYVNGLGLSDWIKHSENYGLLKKKNE